VRCTTPCSSERGLLCVSIRSRPRSKLWRHTSCRDSSLRLLSLVWTYDVTIGSPDTCKMSLAQQKARARFKRRARCTFSLTKTLDSRAITRIKYISVAASRSSSSSSSQLGVEWHICFSRLSESIITTHLSRKRSMMSIA
jgi:hypothetical protein